jgi:hypothetical protein
MGGGTLGVLAPGGPGAAALPPLPAESEDEAMQRPSLRMLRTQTQAASDGATGAAAAGAAAGAQADLICLSSPHK